MSVTEDFFMVALAVVLVMWLVSDWARRHARRKKPPVTRYSQVIDWPQQKGFSGSAEPESPGLINRGGSDSRPKKVYRHFHRPK